MRERGMRRSPFTGISIPFNLIQCMFLILTNCNYIEIINKQRKVLPYEYSRKYAACP